MLLGYWGLGGEGRRGGFFLLQKVGRNVFRLGGEWVGGAGGSWGKCFEITAIGSGRVDHVCLGWGGGMGWGVGGGSSPHRCRGSFHKL